MVNNPEADADLEARRAALERHLAAANARAKPQFAELEKFRDKIQTHIGQGTPVWRVLRCLKEDDVQVTVSYQTLCRYIREKGFAKPASRRRKRKPPAKPKV
jgi:hypothetical protein